MNVRYFFIAGAITSGLALALQESYRSVNKQPSPIVAPYTVEENDLELLEPISGTLDTLNILGIQSNSVVYRPEVEDLYQQGENLLHALYNFVRSVIMFCINMLFSRG
ncbi:hypothetical protein [Bartonella taylorii]|uniref:hypothetical protein n=1 Tax=Bartonella taylorii TaxID=33046 RepID=UPI001ABAA4DD|nr:hypothetical protein [Bartonella taylorii]